MTRNQAIKMKKHTADQVTTVILIIAILGVLGVIRCNSRETTQIATERYFCLNKTKLSNVYWNEKTNQCMWRGK